MKTRSYTHLALVVVGVLVLSVTLSVIFSRAQQDTAAFFLQNPASAVTEEQIAALAEARRQAFFTNRIPHTACANCFKVGDGRYGIYEEVPGTGKVLSRDLPDPAPLQKGEVRPEYDDETGEPIWYIGTQGFVGPMDEEPLSDSLPVPKIELKRIKARHEDQLFRVKGVHGVGIGEHGLVVFITPEQSKNQKQLPTSLDGIPVVVEESAMYQQMSHGNNRYRPVPVGSDIVSHVSFRGGTIGPHAVRDVADIGTCCQIWSLTAGHVIQPTERLPSSAIGGDVSQGGSFWGTIVWVFQQTRCDSAGDPTCNTSGPLNDTRFNPDAAAVIRYAPNLDPYPKTPPCQGSSSPTRKMQYGRSSWVHGPSGVIRIPTFSNCGSVNCLKMWGKHSDAPLGLLRVAEGQFVVRDIENTMAYYRVGPVDQASYERGTQGGDSGALVAWNGSGNRQVVGLHFAAESIRTWLGLYQRADYIKTAFYNAGRSFDHYWGTDATASRPSSTQYDNPC